MPINKSGWIGLKGIRTWRLTMWYGRMSVRFSLNHTDDSAVESGDNQQRTNQGTLNAWQWCLLLAFCGHVHVTCIKGRMCLHINYTLHPLLTNHFLFPPCSCNDFERFVASFFINHSHPLVESVNTLISMFSSLQP